MKLLRTILDKTEPLFESRLLRPFKCIFDATDAFFFAPGAVTDSEPHVRDAMDVKRYMSIVIVAVLPAAAASIYFFGLHVLAMILVSYVVGGLAEVAFSIVRKEEITEGLLVTGLLFPLVLPPATALWIVAVGAAFGVVFGKEVFGGTGRNLFNPALVGRCFVAIAYPKQLAEGWIVPGSGWMGRVFEYVGPGNVDAVAAATPLTAVKAGGAAPALWKLLLGNVSGSAGETSVLLILLGGAFLCFTKVGNWRIPVSTLASAAVSAAVLHGMCPDTFAPAAFQLCAGGLMFGAVFMATDPVTAPSTNPARVCYGALIGLITVLIRGLTGYVEGVMFAILLMNIFAPLLDEAVVQLRRRKYAVAK